MYCRAWSCDHCAPRRKTQLIAAALSGRPTALLTLTVNPGRGNDPDSRALELAHAWRKLRRHLIQVGGHDRLPFLAVFEATHRGEPHLHILLRAKFIPQKMISDFMAHTIDAPIVDIRAINDPEKAGRYVAKYLGKNPHRFGKTKRYWSSRDWEVPAEGEAGYTPPAPGEWKLVHNSLEELEENWRLSGWVTWLGDDDLVAVLPPEARASPG
jgi:hypothetical protein